jgi:hypothetical protein
MYAIHPNPVKPEPKQKRDERKAAEAAKISQRRIAKPCESLRFCPGPPG